VQVNDGLYAEVPLWCASGPIARRRIDLVCLEAFWLQEWEWVLEDSHKRSCWKNSIGVDVPRPYRSDVYVCSRSFRHCLTVVYWLLECIKVPSWIENPEYVTVCTFVKTKGVSLYSQNPITGTNAKPVKHSTYIRNPHLRSVEHTVDRGECQWHNRCYSISDYELWIAEAVGGAGCSVVITDSDNKLPEHEVGVPTATLHILPHNRV
jgi:hypothetical protein